MFLNVNLRNLNDEHGVTAIEYAILTACIVATCAAGAAAAQTTLSRDYETVGNHVGQMHTTQAQTPPADECSTGTYTGDPANIRWYRHTILQDGRETVTGATGSAWTQPAAGEQGDTVGAGWDQAEADGYPPIVIDPTQHSVAFSDWTGYYDPANRGISYSPAGTTNPDLAIWLQGFPQPDNQPNVTIILDPCSNTWLRTR